MFKVGDRLEWKPAFLDQGKVQGTVTEVGDAYFHVLADNEHNAKFRHFPLAYPHDRASQFIKVGEASSPKTRK
jgi:hypothetical protein